MILNDMLAIYDALFSARHVPRLCRRQDFPRWGKDKPAAML
jgi:hypothetical protein